MIILVGGAIGSGKDTFYKIASECINNTKQFSFADVVKDIVVDLSLFYKNIHLDKNLLSSQTYKSTPLNSNLYIDSVEYQYTPRLALQYTATNILRKHLGDDIFACHVANKIKEYFIDTPHGIAIITDLRFPNEIEYIKKIIFTNVISVYIDRQAKTDSHISENLFSKIKFDYIIKNNGSIDEFKSKIINLLTIIKKKKMMGFRV